MNNTSNAFINLNVHFSIYKCIYKNHNMFFNIGKCTVNNCIFMKYSFLFGLISVNQTFTLMKYTFPL